MEIEVWVQASNAIVITVAKQIKTISSTDLLFYSLYAAVMLIGVSFKIEAAKPSKVLPLILTLFFSALAYHLMLNEKESNYYIITTMFYVQAMFYYSKVNLKTSIACAIMALYLFTMSREAAYYENYGSSFSDVLHDSYWMVIFLLHCVICGSFFSRREYKRAYMGLRSYICRA
jgi:hypothetical protein